MRVLLTRLLLLAIVTSSACAKKEEPEVVPKPPVLEPLEEVRNLLLNPKGYWEWVESVSFAGRITPATVGLSKQLEFKGDGQVYIFHNQQLVAQSPYLLTMSMGVICKGITERPFIEYVGETSPARLRNSNLRSLTVKVLNTGGILDTVMGMTGDGGCLDGGTSEGYRWHHR